jgi:hypothetical protein
MIVWDTNFFSTCPIYKIWFHIYLPNYLGYELPGPGIQAEWANSWLAPLFLSSEFMIHGTHGTKYRLNHDGENRVWAKSECEKLQQKNQAYMGNDHHDEDVSHIRSV